MENKISTTNQVIVKKSINEQKDKKYNENELQKLDFIVTAVKNTKSDIHSSWGNHTKHTKGW